MRAVQGHLYEYVDITLYVIALGYLCRPVREACMKIIIAGTNPEDYEPTSLQRAWVDEQIAKARPFTARQRAMLSELLRPAREDGDNPIAMLVGAA